MTTTAVTQTAAVTLAGVSKTYGRGAAAVHALDQVSLSTAPGEFTCIIGASGCGKSTLLSLVAGLDQPTGGDITVNGRVAFMFQEPGLFPWLTAGGNVELALRARKVPRSERKARTARAARIGPARRVRRQAAARAVRRHAPAGSAGPRACPGRGRAADGRAVRRAGRDDPRRAARRARPGQRSASASRSPSCSSRTTCARRSASATASCCCPAGPAGSSRSTRSRSTRPRRIDSGPVAELAAGITDRLRAEVSRHGS